MKRAMTFFYNIRKITIDDIRSFVMLLGAYIPSLLVSKNKGKVWLCCERITIADDNAWILYNWLRKNLSYFNIW